MVESNYLQDSIQPWKPKDLVRAEGPLSHSSLTPLGRISSFVQQGKQGYLLPNSLTTWGLRKKRFPREKKPSKQTHDLGLYLETSSKYDLFRLGWNIIACICVLPRETGESRESQQAMKCAWEQEQAVPSRGRGLAKHQAADRGASLHNPCEPGPEDGAAAAQCYQDCSGSSHCSSWKRWMCLCQNSSFQGC